MKVRVPGRGRLARAAGPLALAAPAVCLVAAALLVPLAVGLGYAVRDARLLDPGAGAFVGLDNFRRAAEDPALRAALSNTLVWTAGTVALQFGLGFALALLLDRPFRGRGAFQALLVLPWAVPACLAALDWAWLFNPAVSPAPGWLAALGLSPRPENILSSPDHALWGPIAAATWWGVPYFALTLRVALGAVPNDLYEAAALDGAGALRRFTAITLPLTAPAIALTVALRAVWVANFTDFIVVMTKGGPADTTQTVATYAFTQAYRRLDFGYASAISAIWLAILLGCALAWAAARRA